MAQSGAKLIEVGTTNRTTLQDYASALSDTSAAILKVHRSNFFMSGFVDEVSARELSALCRENDLLLLEDLGSGAVHDLSKYGLPRERTWSDAIRDGSDLVSISGDKLLGGPQAGLIAGSGDAVARAVGHPLYRALRPGKMALAAMSVTLRAHLSGAHEKVLPLYRLLSTDVAALRTRASAIEKSVESGALQVKESETLAGGGTLPQAVLPSISLVVTIDSPDRALTVLRNFETPVIARVQNDRVWLDLKTVFPDQDALLIRAIMAILE
jgi:L-seryl-tRNA(Ser) seleniumtransferase